MPQTDAAIGSTAAATAPRVLLVDDNATNLQVLLQTLDGRGYQLLVARSGDEALAIAQRARPSLILLDVMMPGLDGFAVCQRLKADPVTRDTSVIFLSARDEAGDRVRGLDLGAVDYIGKPFQPEEVIARVNTHLTIHQLQRDLSARNLELEAANRRMRRDLEAAARVQQALLPERAPAAASARFAWCYRPCDELAGDALDAFVIDDRHIGLYVIDVSGHGVPSALLSVSVTRSLSPRADRASVVTDPLDQGAGSVVVSPAEVAARLNAMYQMDARTGQYFTLLYGLLELDGPRFRFVSPGHPGPIRLRPDAPPAIFDEPAVPIGLMPGSSYADRVLNLRPGDRLYLHSDGLSDETAPDGEPFGRDRLLTALHDGRTLDLQRSVDRLVDEVIAWKRSDRLSDDISVLAVEVL